jgi:hypothetical protein
LGNDQKEVKDALDKTRDGDPVHIIEAQETIQKIRIAYTEKQ